MACGCKKNAAASSSPAQVAQAAPKAASSAQEAKPQKKIVNRIIKREIR